MDQRLKKELQKSLQTKEFKGSHKLLRAVCGPTRYKIIHLLKQNPIGLTVTDMAQILNSSLSKVSHQIKILKEYKLISARGQNRETIYSLADHRIQNFFK